MILQLVYIILLQCLLLYSSGSFASWFLNLELKLDKTWSVRTGTDQESGQSDMISLDPEKKAVTVYKR